MTVTTGQANKTAGVITGVHHVNLLVRDLEQAMASYRAQLGVDDFIVASLAGRGVRTARFKAGETWIVLVQPVAEGEPMRQLRERGEGLFLLSFAVDDLEAASATVLAGGGSFTSDTPRRGLADWEVIDLEPAHIHQAPLQLTNLVADNGGVS